MYRLFVVIGFVIMVFSLFFVIAALAELFGPATERKTEVGVLWGLAVFFGLTAWAGGVLAYSQRHKGKRTRLEKQERKLLQIIAQNQGRVTVMEVAAQTNLTVQEAEAALRSLARSGRGELKLTGEGVLVYVFSGFADAADKAAAKGVTEW